MIRLPSWVLVGCLLIFSACSSGEPTVHDFAKDLPTAISESIDEAIDDPARAQAAKNVAIKLEYAIGDYNEEAWKIRTRAFYLNANYNTSAEKYETFLAELHELRSKKQAQVVQYSLEARATMSAQEWQALHDALDERLKVD